MGQGWIRSHSGGLAAVYRLLDGLLVVGALCLCAITCNQKLTSDWLLIGLLASIGFAFAAESMGLYRSWRSDTQVKLLGYTILAWVLVCALLVSVGYFSKTAQSYSRVVVGSWFFLTLIVLCAWRIAFRYFLFFIRSHDHNTRTAVIVGLTEEALRLAQNFATETQLGIRVKGFYRVTGADTLAESQLQVPPEKILGDVCDAVAAAKAGEVDLVYIALPMREELKIVSILGAFSDTTATVLLLADIFAKNVLHSRWYQVGDANILSIYDTPIDGINSWLKRLEDVLLSSVILTLISPLLLLIAVAVKSTSRGPIIFRQNRYGLDGRPIEVWKFRTMTSMENGDHVRQATRDDTRLTSIGRFLRKTSLDELPQFFNVLQGHMSIVGPRPHAVAHNEQYRCLVDGYMLRHKVKPGITGWAQVNGWRGETDTVEKMRKRVEHDLHYIRHWSIALDMQIVLMTLVKGFVGKNAY